MKRDDLIKISEELRKEKDKTKAELERGNIASKVRKENRIVIPPLLFKPSREILSDKWLFNGFVIDLENNLVVVDPGADFYSRFTNCGLSTLNISSIILSHEHIDHSASINVFLDQILRNKHRRTNLFIPRVAFNNVVSAFYRKNVEEANYINLIFLEDQGKLSFNLESFKIEFLPLFHSSVNFGFKINLDDSKMGYISDTGYAKKIKTIKGVFNPELTEGDFISIQEKHDYIKQFYSDLSLSIVNINDLHYNRHSKYHLSGWDVLDIFQGSSSVKRLLLQHLAPLNVFGKESNYIYKDFFSDQSYEILLSSFETMEIKI